MGIFRQFPYTNFHEMNLDWIMEEIKKLSTEWLQYNSNWEQWKTDTDNAFNELKNYVLNYFDENNVETLIVEYLNELKDSGFFDSVIYTLTRTTINANMVWSDFIDITNPSLVNGTCYIGNNKIACYFSSLNDVGTLKIFDATTWQELASENLQLYHGNSLTYKDGKIYACACYSQTDISILLPDIFVVDVSDLSNIQIDSTIVPPLPNYSTGIYSLSYDPTTDKFHAICARGSVDGEYNRLIEYSGDLTTITNQVILNGTIPADSQGVQCVYNNIAYLIYYDLNYAGAYAFDITTGDFINAYCPPHLINGYRFIGELQSITYNYDNNDWFMFSRHTECSVYRKSGYSVFEVGINKNIPKFEITNGNLNQKQGMMGITVDQGASGIATNFFNMKCLRDAINVSVNAGISAIIAFTNRDRRFASIDINNFNGAIYAPSNNHLICDSPVNIYNSNIRLAFIEFSGSTTNIISNVAGNVAAVNSNITSVGCTFTDKLAIEECILFNQDANTPIHAQFSFVTGQAATPYNNSTYVRTAYVQNAS